MKSYGGFLARFIALLIDWVLLSLPQGYFKDSQGLWFILATLYFVWMNGMYGATVGKMVMKLKITKENGAKITYADALIRELSSYLSLAVLGLGYLNVIWDGKKQGWHDKIAKTVVVKAT